MADMREREKAFETKYALDQEMMFRIEARTAKLFALWLAEQAGMNETDAKEFAASVISANLEEAGFEDVKRAVKPIIDEKNLALSEHAIDSKLEYFMEQARIQLSGDAA